MNKAKAAVFMGINQAFEVKEYPITEPTEGMVQLDLIASGICGTDVHILTGRIPLDPPKIIGHEFVGRITSILPADRLRYNLQEGDAVIVDIACPCGECVLCRSGDDANCIRLGVTNGGDPEVAPHFYGGYGEVNYSPAKNLVKIPESLNPRIVAVYACAGPTALHAFSLAKQANCGVEHAQVAVVQGLGPVGSFAVAYLASLGIPHVIALTAGNNPEREALAYKLGATEVLNIDKIPYEEIKQRIFTLNEGLGADVVFEASGSRVAVPQGMNLLRNRGTYLVPGQYSNSGAAEIQPQKITFGALRIIGSSQYSLSDVKQYLDFMEDNRHLHATIDSLITAYTIEEVNKAFDDIRNGKNIKSMFVPKKTDS